MCLFKSWLGGEWGRRALMGAGGRLRLSGGGGYIGVCTLAHVALGPAGL